MCILFTISLFSLVVVCRLYFESSEILYSVASKEKMKKDFFFTKERFNTCLYASIVYYPPDSSGDESLSREWNGKTSDLLKSVLVKVR